MKRRLKLHIGQCVLFTIITCLFVTCQSSYNGNVSPNKLYSSQTYGGQGTSYSQGALYFNIQSSNGYYSNYQYYQVNISGLGIYSLPTGSNTLFIPYVWPGSYSYTIYVNCINSYNSGCYQRYINGYVNVNSSYTTNVTAYP